MVESLNTATLTLDELVSHGYAGEILRRLRRGEAHIADDNLDQLMNAYETGYEDGLLCRREVIIADVIDLLNGETWSDGMTDDQRAFLIEDLDAYVEKNDD